jgi:hypothetical protein
VILLTALLFAVCTLSASATATRDNLGLVLGWPLRLAELIFGPLEAMEPGTIMGALGYTAYHGLNLLFLYLVSAIILRQRPKKTAADDHEPRR